MATGKCSERCNIAGFQDELGYVWDLKYGTNEPILKKKQTQGQDIMGRLVVAKGAGWKKVDWKFKISRCQLLYIEWIKPMYYSIAQGTIFNIL